MATAPCLSSSPPFIVHGLASALQKDGVCLRGRCAPLSLLLRNASLRTCSFPAGRLRAGRATMRRANRLRGGVARPAVATAALAGPGPVRVAAGAFQLGTAFVVPFYTVMILAPRWEWTRRLMESEVPHVVLGAAYFYLLCLSWTPETVRLMFSSRYWLPELPGITRMFASTLTVASAWLHLLAADLFAGRQVFLDGVAHGVETRHSLVLCLMMCPIGILSHLLTKSIVLFLRRASSETGSEEVTAAFPPC